LGKEGIDLVKIANLAERQDVTGGLIEIAKEMKHIVVSIE
jgi:hypothetical protein|tara:strand:+ start:1246 stop:1365 length:120 start_codon:yes stop_codon:yes gene_type:complete